jgi:hypothetical protein
MSTRLAKDSARDVVASEQASAIKASKLTTMYFTIARLSPSIHLLDIRQLQQIRQRHFLLGRGAKKFDANQF